MKFIKLEKVKDGKYLKNYEITYLNKAGKEKKYEMVSRKELADITDIGKRASGVSIVAFHEDKLLLLREFRMSVNKTIFNLCAGMIEEGESIEECISRELYEETGLSISNIRAILPPSYSAVGISDMKTYIAIVDVEGDFSDHTSDNEMIQARFYSREEVAALLQTEEFSSRSQIVSYFFITMKE
jgi:ADP-ribose pyrophosphatase